MSDQENGASPANGKSAIDHVYVCTPAYDGKVDSDYSQSLAEACQAATIFGIRVTAAVMGNGAFIDLARNLFVKFFLENPELKDATHLFFIDSDLKFEASAFCNLVAHCTEDRPVLAGAYRRRQDPEDYPIKWTPHPEISEEKGQDCLWVEDPGWLACNRVATGFMIIRREILEEMAADAPKLRIAGQKGYVPQLFYTKVDEENRFVGEDYCFCDDFTERYGKQIWVWPDWDFVHSGYKGNYARWLDTQIKSYQHNQRKMGDIKMDISPPPEA